ncbi:19898_t:CDS:1, partial [Rhizophagus irregularis]
MINKTVKCRHVSALSNFLWSKDEGYMTLKFFERRPLETAAGGE